MTVRELRLVASNVQAVTFISGEKSERRARNRCIAAAVRAFLLDRIHRAYSAIPAAPALNLGGSFTASFTERC
jgi:hypothetical protein